MAQTIITPDPQNEKSQQHRQAQKLSLDPGMRALDGQIQALYREFARYHAEHHAQAQAMSGSMVLVNLSAASENISAAVLNAAAAGTVKRAFSVTLEDGHHHRHTWCRVLALLSGEAAADPDIDPPAVAASVTMKDGAATVNLTFDTDAGATKTYAPGDTLTITVKVATDDKLLGYTVAPVVKTYVVVA